MIGDTTETWTYTAEMLIRDWDGKPVWTRTPGIEVDEHTAREAYRQAIRDGLPAHLRAPRVTRVIRTTIDEPDTATTCPRGGQCPNDCGRTPIGCHHTREPR